MLTKIECRLNEEQKNKRDNIKWCLTEVGIQIKPLGTRFFPTAHTYAAGYLGTVQPTLFIPFGKILGTIESDPTNSNCEKATLAGALLSIPIEFFYDIYWATIYFLIAVPSLFLAAYFAIHATFFNNSHSEEKAYEKLGNVVCAPYFMILIVVDISREILALATRTYATLTESAKGRQQDYWCSDNDQFKSATK